MAAALAVPARADNTFMSTFAQEQYISKYAWKDEDGTPTEVWPDTAYRVVRSVLGALGYTDRDPEFQDIFKLIVDRKFLPGGRYLANSGKKLHQVNNCFLYRCEDSREGWKDLVGKSMMSLMLGGGVGAVYSDVRASGSAIHKTEGHATGPLSPMQMVNEVARHIIGGGNRRSAIWAGLQWDHDDIFEFIKIKDWSPEVRAAKEADWNNPAPLDMTNVSVILNTEFFFAYENEKHPKHNLAQSVYWTATEQMLRHGEPGFSIDAGPNEGENLRNACTEITSYDDSDVCNLGSINMARIDSIEEFERVTELATLFLIAGTVYSDIPHPEVKVTREKNRRLGLGLMGVHEWLLVRGYRYEVTSELHDWLSAWRNASDSAAERWAKKHDLSVPVKKRSIAPNGTIGLIAESTQSGEPIDSVAKKRVWLGDDKQWKGMYIINPVAARLIEEQGVNPEDIEDAYVLAYDYERRIKFQADLQAYVDHGISSTVNLPYPIVDPAEVKEFGDTLMGYLPRLRGITCYPDGARAGQPITPVPYEVAKAQENVVFEANDDACRGGVCGL